METKLAFKSQEGKQEVLKFYDSLLDRWPVRKINYLSIPRYEYIMIAVSKERHHRSFLHAVQ
jgi:hypothetical protein